MNVTPAYAILLLFGKLYSTNKNFYQICSHRLANWPTFEDLLVSNNKSYIKLHLEWWQTDFKQRMSQSSYMFLETIEE